MSAKLATLIDDFDGSAVNSSLWTRTGTAPTVSGGILTAAAGGTTLTSVDHYDLASSQVVVHIPTAGSSFTIRLHNTTGLESYLQLAYNSGTGNLVLSAGDFEGGTGITSLTYNSTNMKFFKFVHGGFNGAVTSYSADGTTWTQIAGNSGYLDPLDGVKLQIAGANTQFAGVNVIPRYWVGGTGSWHETSHWSVTSGGASGASVPTSSNSVIFDASSNTGTGSFSVTIGQTGSSYQASCASFNCSAIDGAMTLIAGFSSLYTGFLNVYGSVTLSTLFTSSNVYTNYGNFKIVGSGTLTTNGCTTNILGFSIGNGTVACTVNLADNITFSGQGFVEVSDEAILNTNNYTLNIGNSSGVFGDEDGTGMLVASGGTLNLGTSVVNLVKTGWLADTGSIINASTSIINASGGLGLGSQFIGGSNSYGVLNWVALANSTTMTITGNNSFNSLNLSNGGFTTTTVRFTQGSTTTVSDMTAVGASGNLLILKSSADNAIYTLTKSSGRVNVSYVSIQDSTAAGGASWRAANSTDNGNNTGWFIYSGNTTGLAPLIYYFDGHAGLTDPDSAWTNDANGFDSSISTYAYTEAAGTVGLFSAANHLNAMGTSASSTADSYIVRVKARIRGDSEFSGQLNATVSHSSSSLGTLSVPHAGSAVIWGAWVELSVPTGGWTWTKIADELRIFVAAGTGSQGNWFYGAQIEVTTAVSSTSGSLITTFL